MPLNKAKIREDFPIVERFNFLDHANMAPSPIQVVKAVTQVMMQKATHSFLASDIWSAKVEKARENSGKLLGVPKEGVWFVNNTSEGMNTIANGVRWQTGENVVMPDIEFPSNVYPFLRKKGELEIKYVKARYTKMGVEVSLDQMERTVDDKTRVVCLSAVDFGFGIRYDLKRISEIAHKHGALMVLDASQAAGAIQMHAKDDGVDMIALGGQKWTLAPSAGGIFYMNPELIRDFEPPNVGWNGVESPGDQMLRNYTEHFELAKDARRFALGHHNFPGIIGLEASSSYLLDLGMDNIEREVLKLTRTLIDGLDELDLPLLSPREDLMRAGIVSFAIKNPAAVMEFLKRNNIIVSGAVQTRGRGIRVSPDFYNTEGEIRSLLGKLKQHQKKNSLAR